MKKLFLVVLFGLFTNLSFANESREISCVNTAWAFFKSHQVCVFAIRDPDVSGVTCHLSMAKTGGLGGLIGIAESPSEFSIACRQTGVISLSKEQLQSLDGQEMFGKSTNIFFKQTKIIRTYDSLNNVLIYLVISSKLIDGSPKNSISTIPLNKF